MRYHAAMTLGEEPEQTFAKMSRYFSFTKRMSKARKPISSFRKFLFKIFLMWLDRISFFKGNFVRECMQGEANGYYTN